MFPLLGYIKGSKMRKTQCFQFEEVPSSSMVAPGPTTPWYQHKRSKAFQGQELLNVSSPGRMLMPKLIPKRWGYTVCLIYIYMCGISMKSITNQCWHGKIMGYIHIYIYNHHFMIWVWKYWLYQTIPEVPCFMGMINSNLNGDGLLSASILLRNPQKDRHIGNRESWVPRNIYI